MEDVPKITILSPLNTRESRRSGRIIWVPDRFMFLGEVVSDELDLDLSSYNESISDKDSRNWQSDMKVEMEFLYSNHVWKII